ncbi:MAG: methylmalonyl-CoA epimerase [Candidatus Marinimicrobia bacterium]|nr:methylmalonyl-CoA epimerase [Candidatus Neomarinimicrobiota bacterium]
MLTQINHIGIAVKSLEEQIPFYQDVLKMEFAGIEEVPDQMVKVAMFRIGEAKIELLEPTSADSPIAKYIEKKGEGIHHIAYQTDNIDEEIENIQTMGLQMIDQTPRTGAHETKIAFIHPKSSGKVLTELTEVKHGE